MTSVSIETIHTCDISMNNAIIKTVKDRVGLFHDGTIYSGLLVLPVFTVLVFSYNYHALWLVYDIVAMILLFHYATTRQKRITNIQRCFLVVVIWYFLVLVLVSGHWLKGVLSVWDTFKHLLYLPLMATINRESFSGRNAKLSRRIYILIGFAFFIQMIAVGVQYNAGIHFDDVAGTFGDGGSHAIAYISLLIIAASIAFTRRFIFIFGLISITIMMNMAAENVGFFILISMVMFSILVVKKLNIKFLFLIAAMMSISCFFLGMSFYTESSFGEVIMSRVIDMFKIPDYYDPLENHGRNYFLFLAFSIGGWFGHGPCAYSNIYLLEGYDFASLVDQQININEASHLIAESGLIGLCLTMMVYILFVVKLFNKLIVKSLMALIFVACMFYSAVLMTESHIFMLLLTFYYFRILEDQSVSKLKYSGLDK